MTSIRGYVFDAYGTLFDVHSVVEAGCEITRDPAALSATWRQKQLEYTWLRALMGRYEEFWAVTESALRYAIRRLGLTASEAQVRRLMEAYLSLACFPEVAGALERLAGRPRAILSNGAPSMLEAAVRSSGLGRHLQHVISVDAVKTYKPSPRVYALGPETLGVPAGEPLRVVERVGRGGGEGLRLRGGVVQPARRARGRAGRAGRRRRSRPHPAPALEHKKRRPA